jgi:hypothetical protein
VALIQNSLWAQPQVSKEKQIEFEFVKGFGLSKIEKSSPGNYLIKTQIIGLEELEVIRYQIGKRSSDNEIVIAVLDDSKAKATKYFGLYAEEGDTAGHWFSAATLNDFLNKTNSFRAAANAQVYRSFQDGKVSVEALSFAILNLVRQNPPAPLDVPVHQMINVVRCQGQDPIRTADKCRAEAIRNCISENRKATDISTSLRPNGQGGFFGVTNYGCGK